MRILVLGADGMLGHQLAKSLIAKHAVWEVTRADFDVRDSRDVWEYLWWAKPEVVINCVGIVKQREVEPAEMIEVNALFPQRLAEYTRKLGARLIHFSTDCVFSGRKGSYEETDEPDPQDLYGRSKLLGEVSGPGCVTLRTSLIGRELTTKRGLVEWFLSQSGTAPGFVEHRFSGVTTIEAARIVERVLQFPQFHGVYHVGGYSISKYSTLKLLRHFYCSPVLVDAVENGVCNRSLDSSLFCELFRYERRDMSDMIKEMVNAER
jgi:dTDP-4-dehydrorhamnose reductase